MAATAIRTIIVDDNRLVRDGLASLLTAQSGFKVPAAVDTAKACLAALDGKTAVVLVDAILGKTTSRHLIEQIRDTAPATKIVVMDLMPAEQDIIQFIQAGANGFVVKDATIEQLVTTVRAVAAGGSVIPPVLTGTVLTHIAAQAAVEPEAVEAVRMTRREREVIALIADGLSNKEIATRLNMATDTVKSHVHNILEKLALHSRLQIAAHAHRGGGRAAETGKSKRTT